MAEIIAQTWTDPDGTMWERLYDPNTGQYRDVNVSDAYNVGSSFLPPDDTTYPAAPTPTTAPIDPGQPTYGGETQPLIQNVTTPDGPYQVQMQLDPQTNEWVPLAINPSVGDSVAPIDDGSGASGGTVTDSSGGGAGGGYTDSSGYYHSGSGYSRGSSGGSSSGSSGGYGGYSSGGGPTGMDNLAAARQMQTDWIAQHTQGGGGGSSQKDATVPGGAAACGWGARSAPPVSSHYSGGGSSGGGGGGGQIGGVIRQIRSNILGNLGGMFGGGSSYSSNYHSPKPSKPPKPFQPPDPRMHGFARPYDNLNAKGSVFTHPEWLIPRAVGVPAGSGSYDMLKSLPMGPLAQLLADSRTRGYDDTNKYINTAGRLYDQIANGPTWFDPSQLMNRLLHPKQGTQLAIQFGKGTPPLSPQDQYYKHVYGQGPGSAADHGWIDPRDTYQPPTAGTQGDQMMQYLSAINRVAYGSKTAQAFDHWAQSQIDDWGSRNIRRKPGAGQSLPQFLRGRV